MTLPKPKKVKHFHWFNEKLICRICGEHEMDKYLYLPDEPSKKRKCLGEDCGGYAVNDSANRFCNKCRIYYKFY